MPARTSSATRHGGSHRLGLALVGASTVAWSLAGFFTRLIPLDLWTLLVWRGIFGALGIAAFVVWMRGRASLADLRNLGWLGWLYVAVTAGGMVLFLAALRHTTVAHVSVIYATVPLFAAGLGWLFLRETPSGGALLASLAALVGVVVMVGLGREGTLFGDGLAVLTTLSMAGMMVIARRLPEGPAMAAAGLSALLSGVVCWPLGDPLALTGSNLVLLILFGLVNSALGLALFTWGARLLPPVESALLGALDAPLAPVWVWLAFAEAPSRSTVIGGLLVFAAVGLHIGHSAWTSEVTRAPEFAEP